MSDIRLRYIYCTINNLNHKTYIGQRTCYSNHDPHASRKAPETDNYIGSGFVLQKAIKKHGKENFTKVILYQSLCTKEEIDEAEKYYIRLAKMVGKAEYNITNGGQGGDLGVGDIISERVKKTWNDRREFKIKRMREGQAKFKEDHERWMDRNRKLSINLKGKGRRQSWSDESLEKLRQRMKGNTLSKGKGTKKSIEAKEKNRQSHIGRHFYNNGIIMIQAYNCPEGFKPGMLKKIKVVS